MQSSNGELATAQRRITLGDQRLEFRDTLPHLLAE
jgi:hypothetical protein